MVSLHNKHPQKGSPWCLVAEFMAPDPQNPHRSLDAQITEILAKAGLEPEQQRRIRLSIQQALMDLDAPGMTLLIRISISGTGINNPPSLTSAGSLPAQPAGTGVGFFLVRRIVSQFHESSRKSQRMLEVLIYRD